MGACGTKLSAEQKQMQIASKQIDAQTNQDYLNEKRTFKLLLLGPGECGKSTISKQMNQIYGNGFDKEDLKVYTHIVRLNVLNSIKQLIKMTDVLKTKGIENTEILLENQSIKEEIIEINEKNIDWKDLSKKIEKLWTDPGIQKTFECKSMYQLQGPGDYFFIHILRIGENNYIPTYDDMLRARVRTTGIIEKQYNIENNIFKMFDVGGQRSERKKWMHCFESVTAVIFVAAISEYDEKLFEDENVPRMEETLKLFNEVCNGQWFQTTNMILFLNKYDLFVQKIKKVALKDYFSDYSGPEQDPENALEFLKKKFVRLNQNPNKEIYVHTTCATDTSKIKKVMSCVTDIVIKQSLQTGGLLV